MNIFLIRLVAACRFCRGLGALIFLLVCSAVVVDDANILTVCLTDIGEHISECNSGA